VLQSTYLGEGVFTTVNITSSRRLSIGLLVTCMGLLSVHADACSLIGCANHGIELRTEFTVRITFDDKPLSGAEIEIIGPQNDKSQKRIMFKTSADGIARIASLAPGDYWLSAEYLGIEAAYHCFHVNAKSSWKAKRSLKYEWGVLKPSTTRMAGRLVDSQPGKGGTPIWNTVHRVDVAISGAKLTLKNATTSETYTTRSDDKGEFDFTGIPQGVYVLHIDAGIVQPGREYEASDHLIDFANSGKLNMLLFKYREAGGGSCGGSSLRLQ